jgi:hypothetical protein
MAISAVSTAQTISIPPGLTGPGNDSQTSNWFGSRRHQIVLDRLLVGPGSRTLQGLVLHGDESAASAGNVIDVSIALSCVGVPAPQDVNANSFAANATFNGTNAAADLSKVIGIVKTGLKRDPVRGGWLLSCREEEALRGVRDAAGFAFRDEMTRGMLMGYPYKASSLVPSTGGVGSDESSIIFCDWDAVVVGSDMNLQIDSSTDATVTDSGGATVSAFQQNLTLVRVIAETDLVVRHAAAVCHLTTVKWGE